MKRIRGGSGLGDSLYVRPVAEYFVRAGEQVTVMSDYADVFINSGVTVQPFRRDTCNVVAHYTRGKDNPNTTQWTDVCTSAGVGDLALSFAWAVRNQALMGKLTARAAGRPIIMVNGGRPPMGRADGYAAEMLPAQRAFDAVLGALSDCFIVEVGKGNENYPLKADYNLSDRTAVSDLLDIATIARALVGQCSFMIPLAECFDKPLLAVWSVRGLVSSTPYIRQCTPCKLLSKPTSSYVMDDISDEGLQAATREWFHSASCAARELQAA